MSDQIAARQRSAGVAAARAQQRRGVAVSAEEASKRARTAFLVNEIPSGHYWEAYAVERHRLTPATTPSVPLACGHPDDDPFAWHYSSEHGKEPICSRCCDHPTCPAKERST